MVTRQQEPVLQDGMVVRSEEIVRLLKSVAVNSTTVYPTSEPINTRPFRRFLLHLDIDSTSTPTTLRVEVQFANTVSGRWHTYKQGLFASLYWEDGDTASGVQECFEGNCAGRLMRIKLTGVGVSGSAYFTVTASAEFMN